jgi:hypothetical protein
VIDINRDDFHREKDDWLIYREMGHRNSNGGFEPPLSLSDAISMPERKRAVFRTLDYIYSLMEMQWLDLIKKDAEQNG